MKEKNVLILVIIIQLILGFFSSAALVNQRGVIHKLNEDINNGVVSNKKIKPEIKLTTDGKTVDTLYIYKNNKK